MTAGSGGLCLLMPSFWRNVFGERTVPGLPSSAVRVLWRRALMETVMLRTKLPARSRKVGMKWLVELSNVMARIG